jgi:UDP-N-acetyl-D-glucosamine dehydrogenase
VVRVDVTAAEVAAADAVVVLTDHDAFDYELVGAARHVLDTRRRLDPAPNVEYL